MVRWLDRIGLAATLLLVVFIMHGRAVADVLVVTIDLCFLARSLAGGGWAWLRATWVRIALAFWLWLMVCSLPGLAGEGWASQEWASLEWASLGQAAATARFLLLPAALSVAVLDGAPARRALAWALRAAALYIAGQTLLQLATGRNLQGFPRNGDGELTGPFQHPRAALPFSRLLFPLLLPPLAALLDGPAGRWRRAGGALGAVALAAASLALMVLIGQRMPLLLTLFGFVVTALLLPRLRAVAVAALLAGCVLVAASAALSPPAFHRLVTKFSAQMEGFPDSDYGLIAGRAVSIVAAHPLLGQGFDGFRRTCSDPRYFRPVAWPWPWHGPHAADGGGLAACNIHPHNHYLEAATEAGLPGLALFVALVGAWWAALLRGLGRDPDPLRVGLFVSALLQEWPLSSTGGFTAIELSGFSFVLLGWGLAEARAAARPGSGAARLGQHMPHVPRRFEADHVTGVP